MLENNNKIDSHPIHIAKIVPNENYYDLNDNFLDDSGLQGD
jgi:hypothetical protein